MRPITQKSLTLRDWTFVFAQPTTPRQLITAQAQGGLSATREFREFSDWHREAIQPLERIISPLQVAGLRVIRYPRAKTFVKRLKGESCVALFTHATKGCLEFRDGLVSYDRVFAKISENFCGVLDITACSVVDEQDGVIRAVRSRCPRCVVRGATTDLMPISSWLALSGLFFGVFLRRPATFVEAVLETRSHMERLFVEKPSIEAEVGAPDR